jgi:hypothetical protein
MGFGGLGNERRTGRQETKKCFIHKDGCSFRKTGAVKKPELNF